MKDLVHASIFQTLNCGERLIWHGQPRQGICLREADLFLIPFGFLLSSFSIIWECNAISRGLPGFAAFGVSFVLIGLYLMIGHILQDAARRKKTHYAVTDRRVIIISGSIFRANNSITLNSVNDINYFSEFGNWGTISIGAAPYFYSMMFDGSWRCLIQRNVPQLEMIDNARDVYQLIRQIQCADLRTFERATSRAA
jgi:hypothetical protein